MKLLNGKDTYTIQWKFKSEEKAAPWRDWKKHFSNGTSRTMKWTDEKEMEKFCEELRKANPDKLFRETLWLAAFSL